MRLLNIRGYRSDDREHCLSIFDSNTPQFFAPQDRSDFASFLNRPDGIFLVGEVDGQGLVACGGWYIDEKKGLAGLTWGMVKKEAQQCGYGQALLNERIQQIRSDGRANVIRLRTTQWVQRFFERSGFISKSAIKDGFGLNLDRIEMELNLSATAASKLI